jgi:hypothetical protein
MGIRQMDAVSDDLHISLGRAPTVAELATAMGVTKRDLCELMVYSIIGEGGEYGQTSTVGIPGRPGLDRPGAPAACVSSWGVCPFVVVRGFYGLPLGESRPLDR